MRRLRLVRNLTRVYAKSHACCGGALRWRIGLGCVYTSWVLAVFFQVDGDEDELEVGEEGLVEPVVAGGGLAVVLHAVESAAAWLRAFVSSRDLFCLATENRTQDTGHAPISSPDQSTHNFGRCPTVPHLWNRNLLKHDSINRTMAVFIFEGG